MVTETPLQIALLGFALAAPAVWVWRNPVSATIVVLAYLAFEELILLAVPQTFYAGSRLAPDLLLSVAAVSSVVAAWRSYVGGRPRILWPEVALAFTLVLGVAVAFARRVELPFIIVGVRWLFRYIPVYIVWRLRASDNDRRALLRVTTIIVFVQAIIGVSQALLQSAGVPVLDWMQARVGSADIGGIDIVTGGTKQRLGLPFYVFGTLGRYHRYGIFLAAAGLIPAFLLIYRVRRDEVIRAGLGVTAIALLLSTSRQALLLAVLAIVGAGWFRLGLSERTSRIIRGLSIVGVVAGSLLLAFGFLAVLRGASSFVARLVNFRTLGFRAYYLAVIVPKALHASHFGGFGIGTFGSRPHVAAHADMYLQLGFPGVWALQYSYDSEWAILLGQLGVVGFLLFYSAIGGFGWYAWRALVRGSTVNDLEAKVILASAVCLTSVLPLMGGIGAELGSRTTAYVVWAVIGAAMSYAAPVFDRSGTSAQVIS